MLTTFAVFAGLLATGGTGTINVSVVPGNAIVEVDGQIVKSNTISAKAGTHKVTARANGYSTQSRTVIVGANKSARVAFRLVQAKANKPTVKVPVTKRPVGGIKSPTVGGGKTPVTVKPNKPQAAPINRPAVSPKVTPKVTPKTKPGAGPVVVRRPNTGPNTGNRNPPARGNVSNGGGARGSRDNGGSQSLRPFAILSFVVGGLAITGGVLTHGIASDKAEDFNLSRDRQEKLSLRDEAKGYDTASTVLYGVGATGVVLGVLLLAVDPGESRATVAPLPGGGAMVGYGGTF